MSFKNQQSINYQQYYNILYIKVLINERYSIKAVNKLLKLN